MAHTRIAAFRYFPADALVFAPYSVRNVLDQRMPKTRLCSQAHCAHQRSGSFAQRGSVLSVVFDIRRLVLIHTMPPSLHDLGAFFRSPLPVW